MKQYNVGDKVWLAEYNYKAIRKSCPVCFGEKKVTLILGNGDKVLLPCDYCGKGFDGPTGAITEYEYMSEATNITITKIQSETDQIGEERKYYLNGRFADIQDLFDSEEEALIRCAEKVKQQELEETTKAYKLKSHHLESYAWNAGYHLRQAKQRRKDAEYHEKMAILCQNKVKAK